MRQLIFRNGEQNGDRLQLGDHGQASRVGGVDHIAAIYLAKTNPSANGRRDVRVSQVQLRTVDVGLGGGDGRFIGSDRPADLVGRTQLCIQLLTRDDLILKELLVALVIDLSIPKRRLIFRQSTFGLRQCAPGLIQRYLNRYADRAPPAGRPC